MQVDDLVLVSVDAHVVEPPDLFEGRLFQDEGIVTAMTLAERMAST